MSTISEKILAKSSDQETVSAGDFVKARVDVALNHDVTSVLAFEAMYQMGAEKVWDPDKVIMVLDHVAPPSSVNSARVHNVIRDFVKAQEMKNFFDV
ncbi:3-isopropylmalate dehydratase large subunit, partial [Candidatus Bathyarchaeota archaeon]|nr:3-isopropylmalate dehydratase large subunit [Candidatus Bathyarchaeota archaeon]